MKKHLYIYIVILLITQITIIFDLLNKAKKEIPIIDQPELTDKDGLFLDLDTLELKSDTIKLYYETKIYNYRILPTPHKVELFAKRINR